MLPVPWPNNVANNEQRKLMLIIDYTTQMAEEVMRQCHIDLLHALLTQNITESSATDAVAINA